MHTYVWVEQNLYLAAFQIISTFISPLLLLIPSDFKHNFPSILQ